MGGVTRTKCSPGSPPAPGEVEAPWSDTKIQQNIPSFPCSPPGAATHFPAGVTHLELVWETQTGGRAGIVPCWGCNISSSFLNPPRTSWQTFSFLKRQEKHGQDTQKSQALPCASSREKELYPRINSCTPRLVFWLFFQGNIFSQRAFLMCNEICKSGCTGRNSLMLSSAF